MNASFLTYFLRTFNQNEVRISRGQLKVYFSCSFTKKNIHEVRVSITYVIFHYGNGSSFRMLTPHQRIERAVSQTHVEEEEVFYGTAHAGII